MATIKVVELLKQHKDSLGNRRLRLFAVACCYRIWDKIGPDGKYAVSVAERFADGLAGVSELRAADKAAYIKAYSAADSAADRAADWATYMTADSAAIWASYWSVDNAENWAKVREAERSAQADILLSMLRPERRPTEEDRALFAHPDVQGLARSIYWDRQWELCGVLADALEDAGCTWYDLLSELRRSDIERYRGYWPVDIVLGLS